MAGTRDDTTLGLVTRHAVISVVIPTIAGREHWLAKAMTAFREHKPKSHSVEYLIIDNKPTCGEAWNVGLERARGDYILLSADDIEPTHGWAEVGMHWIEMHHSLPCPRILNTDGSLQSCGPDAFEHETGSPSDVARVPFFPAHLKAAIYPVFENQYAGDYWITWKAQQAGWPTVVVRDFCFTHHMALEGRLDTLKEDWAAFQGAIR